MDHCPPDVTDAYFQQLLTSQVCATIALELEELEPPCVLVKKYAYVPTEYGLVNVKVTVVEYPDVDSSVF